MQTLLNDDCNHPVAQKMQSQVATLWQSGFHIVLCWVPGHMGLPGNEAADDAAMNGYLTTHRVIAADVRSFLRRAIYSSWQDDWSNIMDYKLRDIKHCAYVEVIFPSCTERGGDYNTPPYWTRMTHTWLPSARQTTSVHVVLLFWLLPVSWWIVHFWQCTPTV
jgi:hypothetical protein